MADKPDMAQKSDRELLEIINGNLGRIKFEQDDMKARLDGISDGSDKHFKEMFKQYANETVAAQQAYRAKNGVPSGAPLYDNETGNAPQEALERAADFGGGLFGKGRPKIDYRKMVGYVSPHNPVMKSLPSRNRDLLTDLQNAHDAIVCLKAYVWGDKFKQSTEEERWKRFTTHPDWQWWKYAAGAAGYYKVDEIMNPTAISQLDFTFLSSQLLEYVELNSVLANYFPNFTMPNKVSTIPIQTNHAICKLGLGTASPPVQDHAAPQQMMPPATMLNQLSFDLVTFTAVHAMTFLPFNDDMMEDSIIAWLPRMRSEAALGIVRGTEQAILDGDDAAPHIDTDVTATDDFRFAWNGLRFMCLGDDDHYTDHGDAAISADALEAAAKQLGPFGVDPSDNIYVVPAGVYHDIVNLDETSLVQNWGEGNTLKTGSLARWRGRDIVLSPWVREDTAVGIYDAVGATTYVMCLAPSRFWIGRMGAVVTESTRWAPLLLNIVQTDVRQDFQAVDNHLLTSGQFSDAVVAPAHYVFDVLP